MIIYSLKEWQTTFLFENPPSSFSSIWIQSIMSYKMPPLGMKCSVSTSPNKLSLSSISGRCKLQAFPSEQFLQKYIWAHCYEYFISISSIQQPTQIACKTISIFLYRSGLIMNVLVSSLESNSLKLPLEKGWKSPQPACPGKLYIVLGYSWELLVLNFCPVHEQSLQTPWILASRQAEHPYSWLLLPMFICNCSWSGKCIICHGFT